MVSLTDGPTIRRMTAAGVAVTVLDEVSDEEVTRRLVEHLRRRRTQVVHNHMYRAEIVGTRAAIRIGELGLPRPYIVATVHSSRVRSSEDRDLVAALTPRMDRLIAVSRSIEAKIEREGRTGAPVELIYNGVDLSRYDQLEACCTLPEEYGFPVGSPLVGIVARLEPEKGHATLLDAWPQVMVRIPEARLLIVGEGTLRETLEAQAEALGLLGEPCEGDHCVGTRHARPGAKVVFTGRRDDVPSVTAALDVAVLPSYREALGLAILEAMALSRPVVATNVGGIPEMVVDGVTGLLVPPHDPVALAGAITRLLTDHPLADMVARAGHDLVHDRFCIDLMVDAIEAIYDEGAESRRRARSGVSPGGVTLGARGALVSQREQRSDQDPESSPSRRPPIVGSAARRRRLWACLRRSLVSRCGRAAECRAPPVRAVSGRQADPVRIPPFECRHSSTRPRSHLSGDRSPLFLRKAASGLGGRLRGSCRHVAGPADAGRWAADRTGCTRTGVSHRTNDRDSEPQRTRPGRVRPLLDLARSPVGFRPGRGYARGLEGLPGLPHPVDGPHPPMARCCLGDRSLCGLDRGGPAPGGSDVTLTYLRASCPRRSRWASASDTCPGHQPLATSLP